MRVNFIVTETLGHEATTTRRANRRIIGLLGIYGVVAVLGVALHVIVPSL